MYKQLMCQTAAAFTLSVAASLANAGDVELGLSDHTAELGYSSSFTSDAAVTANWLHHEDNGDLLGVGFYGQGQQGNLYGRIGGKLFFVDAEDNNGEPDGEGHGIAVGGDLRFYINRKLALELDAHYAPSVTSFDEVEHLMALGARISFHLFQSTTFFVGYRNVQVDLEHIKEDARIHEGAYAGLRIRF